MSRRKVAILGGGMAGLATAFELSRTPEQREKFEITIYQNGWRAGGKLASGRNQKVAQRNEEHGLHVWLGFYENAFGLIRDVYDQLEVKSTDAFLTWQDAFKGQDFTPLGEKYPAGWTYWPVTWPTNADSPGTGRLALTPWGALTELVSILETLLGQLLRHPAAQHQAPEAHARSTLEGIFAVFAGAASAAEDEVLHTLPSLAAQATRLARAIEQHEHHHTAAHHASLAALLRLIATGVERFVEKLASDHPAIRGIFHVLVIGLAVAVGLVDPRWKILETGDLSAVDGLELRAFLKENGGCPEVIDEASELRAFYDLAFGFRDGRLDQPSLAAGASIRAILRIVLSMKGHVLYLPQAGFGEAVIAPLVRVLEQNGVRFRWFHRVQRIEVTPDGASVAKVHFAQQAEPIAGRYEPMKYDEATGSWWWPTEPFWDQLKDGHAMEAAGIDFESKWRQPPDPKPVSIAAGEEFDELVLAIAHGVFKPLNDEPTLADELYAACPALRSAIEAQGVVPTQALQLWTRPTLAGLGFTDPKPAMVAAPEILDVWADMTQTLRFERWPAAMTPGFVAYVCAILPTDLYRAPSTERDVPDRALALVLRTARAYYEKHTGWMWPNATQRDAPEALDYDVLVAPPSVTGADRLSFQYVRANVDPTECCVNTLPGTTALRVGARGPQNDGGPVTPWFTNLSFAGDWARSVTDTACVEGAVSSAKAVSRALSGFPSAICGEDFFFGKRRL